GLAPAGIRPYRPHSSRAPAPRILARRGSAAFNPNDDVMCPRPRHRTRRRDPDRPAEGKQPRILLPGPKPIRGGASSQNSPALPRVRIHSKSAIGNRKSMDARKRADVATSYDTVADEYVRRIFHELQDKPLDRSLL